VQLHIGYFAEKIKRFRMLSAITLILTSCVPFILFSFALLPDTFLESSTIFAFGATMLPITYSTVLVFYFTIAKYIVSAKIQQSAKVSQYFEQGLFLVIFPISFWNLESFSKELIQVNILQNK
jgi:hypothetical protein